MSRDRYKGMRGAMKNVKGSTKPTKVEIELDAWEAIKQGVPQHVIASDLGISQSTVSRIKHKYELMEQHEAERDEMDKQIIVAGDKKHGQLTRRAHDTNLYEGTCRLRNGKFKTKRITTVGDAKAKEIWEEWCEDVRAKDAPTEPEPFAKKEEPVEAEQSTSEPMFQDVSDRLPIRKGADPADVAKALGSNISSGHVCMDQTAWACLCAYIEQLVDPRLQPVIELDRDMTALVDEACESDIPLWALSELRTDSDVHIDMASWNRLTEKALDIADGAEAIAGMPDEMYVTWMADKGPHALFTDMESATRTVDVLNSALEFAGVEGRYEVMDVKPWKEA